MTKSTKAILALTFLLAIGAGVALGMLTARSAPVSNDARASWFVDQLQLSDAQQKQMEEIWGELMRDKGRRYGEEFYSLQQKREAEIAGMLSADQHGEYDQINKTYAIKVQELWKRFEQDFVDATNRTRAVLTENQRVKFDAMLDHFRASRGGGGDWMGGPPPMGSGMPPPAPEKKPAETKQ